MGKVTGSKTVCLRMMENGEKCRKEGRAGIQRSHNKVSYTVTHSNIKTKTGRATVHYMNTPDGIEAISKIYGLIQQKYDAHFDWAKKELGKVVKRKAWIVKKLAIKLEMEGMEPSLICAAIVTARLPDISENYPRKVLDAKYKMAEKAHPTIRQN